MTSYLEGNPAARAAVENAPHQLYIGGKWIDATGGATFGVEDPATGETLCEVADATPEDAMRALDAAVDAQADWAATPPNERSEILYRAFQALGERSDELALLMTLEMGKSLSEAAGEITYAAEFFRWFSGEALRLDGYYKQAGNGQSRVLVMRQPIGPCFFITPWNFPTAMGTRKIGPAIAAGCTMVVKPAQQTPLSMLALAQAARGLRPAAGGAQRRHRDLLGQGLRADHQGPAAAQAQLHRLHRGGPGADGSGGRPGAEDLDGARRQRAVPGLRGRRPRRGGRGRHDREDAQRRRGLHLGQPVPRPRVGGRGVRARSSPSGWAR